jgi:hypothetical protein
VVEFVGEPAGQQQSHADLGNEVEQPHDDGVAQRAPEKAENVGIGVKQLLEVFNPLLYGKKVIKGN